MLENYLVSIKCNTFNQSAYIKDTLDGFVMQRTSFPYIAVIVDDASTDGEQEIIKSYMEEHFLCSQDKCFKQWETADAKWTYARHKKNLNCYFVVLFLKKNLYGKPKKNELVKEWFDKSKFTAFCEGDDYWTDSLKLQKQVDFLETHEDYSMCCTGFSQTFESRESEKSIVVFDLDEITIDKVIKGQWIGTLTVVYRKELLSDYKPPFPNLPFGDLPMWCHLAQKGKIKYLKDVTANYRSFRKSASHSVELKKQMKFGLDAMRVREYYAKLANKLDIAQPVFSKNSHYYLEECYTNQWLDFPMDTLWHFVKEYGNPSGYDKLKYWGMKSKLRYRLSKIVLSIFKH